MQFSKKGGAGSVSQDQRADRSGYFRRHDKDGRIHWRYAADAEIIRQYKLILHDFTTENSRKTDDKDKMSVQFRRYMEMNPKVCNFDRIICNSALTSFLSQLKKPDLVISSYTLGEIPSEALRKSVVEQLWEQTDDILVRLQLNSWMKLRK